ncbi:MAG TPA: D-alanyl-D-alanine carboxypeptidase [Acidimicrobiales bacterium]|nr:D-alanyl-D-alanine carboxypeptidase [Acidimicrobiales bacterium]
MASVPPQTPLLSPARLPLTLRYAWAAANARHALRLALSPAVLGKQAAARSCAVAAAGGRVIYADHPWLPVVPASNMKLLSATALLDHFGPSYRYHTDLVAGGPVVRGTLHGNLYLVGGGDPLLRSTAYNFYAKEVLHGGGVYTHFGQLVVLLRAAGVRRVSGSVVGVATRYDSVVTVPSWPAIYLAEGDVGPLSALSVDDGRALAGPPVPAGASPALQAAGLLTETLRADKVAVAGPPGLGPLPGKTTALVSLASPPLRAELGEALQESDNTALELMVKELGRAVYGRGSTAAGTRAVREDLLHDHLPLGGLVNVDGSGLSPADRVTCSLLVAILERWGDTGALAQELPVAARSGTLAFAMRGTVAAGRVMAKTGTLAGVKALSGFVLPPGPVSRPAGVRGTGRGVGKASPFVGPVVFSVVLNDLPPSDIGFGPELQVDQIAEDMAKYPEAPALARFEVGG